MQNKVSDALGFNFNAIYKQAEAKVMSALETKYDFSKYGFQSNVKWNTDNDLLTEVVFSDANLLCAGFKVFFNTKLGLVSNKRSGSVKASMENEIYNLSGDLEFEAGAPRLNTSAVYKWVAKESNATQWRLWWWW